MKSLDKSYKESNPEKYTQELHEKVYDESFYNSFRPISSCSDESEKEEEEESDLNDREITPSNFAQLFEQDIIQCDWWMKQFKFDHTTGKQLRRKLGPYKYRYKTSQVSEFQAEVT